MGLEYLERSTVPAKGGVVVRGGAEGALAPLEFGSSVNPIPTRGGRLCPPNF